MLYSCLAVRSLARPFLHAALQIWVAGLALSDEDTTPDVTHDLPEEAAARAPAPAVGKSAPDLPTAGAGARAAASSDRKSTRLNSSHLGISYAVFCLNKKK